MDQSINPHNGCNVGDIILGVHQEGRADKEGGKNHRLGVLEAMWIHMNNTQGECGIYRWRNPRHRGIGGILAFQDMTRGKKFRMDDWIHVPLSIRYMGQSLIFG